MADQHLNREKGIIRCADKCHIHVLSKIFSIKKKQSNKQINLGNIWRWDFILVGSRLPGPFSSTPGSLGAAERNRLRAGQGRGQVDHQGPDGQGRVLTGQPQEPC